MSRDQNPSQVHNPLIKIDVTLTPPRQIIWLLACATSQSDQRQVPLRGRTPWRCADLRMTVVAVGCAAALVATAVALRCHYGARIYAGSQQHGGPGQTVAGQADDDLAPDAPSVRNEISGTVIGPTIQAGSLTHVGCDQHLHYSDGVRLCGSVLARDWPGALVAATAGTFGDHET